MIRPIHILGNHAGPHLLILAGVHGDEYEPMAAALRLTRLLDTNRLHGSVALVPCSNEAAFQRGQRTAEDDLDLARVCPGDPAGSVTMRTAHAVSTLLRNCDYMIDLHTGGSAFELYPLVGYMLHQNNDVLQTQRDMAKAFGLPLIWGTTPTLEGRTLSVARDACVPAIYAEWLGGGGMQEAGVQAYVKGCLRVMAYLDMIDESTPPWGSTVVIEDAATDSGHLQAQHPSPQTGLFTGVARLGQRVSHGDVIGVVETIDDGPVVNLCAQHDGYLICRRRVGRISQGESAGVVLSLKGLQLPDLQKAIHQGKAARNGSRLNT